MAGPTEAEPAINQDPAKEAKQWARERKRSRSKKGNTRPLHRNVSSCGLLVSGCRPTRSRGFRGHGLWVLDEPESALSFNGCLTLLAVLKDLLTAGNSQVIMSTHSPVLAALPGAQILEAGPWGLRPREWADLDMVTNVRSFLESPERYLRHL